MNPRIGATDAEHDEPVDLDATRRESLVLSEDEAAEVYANQWMYMEILGQDETDRQYRGRILAHHSRRSGIQPTVMAVIEEMKVAQTVPEGVLGYKVLFGVRLFRTAAAWKEYQRQLASSGDERGER